jgi:two-component system phosphate regulon sensor histidine kinase PhoR
MRRSIAEYRLKWSVRSKLFLAYFALIVTVGAVSLAWLQPELKDWIEERVEADLERHARALRVHIGQLGGRSLESFDAITDSLGDATGVRVTLIGDAGRVLGDSQVATVDLEGLDPHDRRPEIVEALAAPYGSARRYSQTLDTDMLYVALAMNAPGPVRFVRVALDLKDVAQVTEGLRALFAATVVLGLFLALLMSALAAHLITRVLQRLVKSAEDLAEGRVPSRRGGVRHDELGKLANYMDRLAADLEGQVERAINARDRFAAVLEAIDAAVIALDERRRVTMLNSAAEVLLELPSDPVGRPLSELLRVPAIHALFDNKEGVSAGFEEIELGYDVPRQVLARVAPFKASEGAVLVLHDVSRLRHLETVRRDFVANVSHELRTPLAIILANTEMLLDGALEDEHAARRFLESMHRSARRLTALVSDLLDLSRLEGGQYTRPSEVVVLADIVANVFEALGAVVEEKGAHISHAVPASLRVEADPVALEQVVFNLVDNALKYSGEGGSVTLGVREDAERVRVEVIDDGPGVPESHRFRLFERFYRVDPGRSREQGGTGLGLAIVKHLITSMGGRVGMTASESGGALFWFELAAPVDSPTQDMA